MNQLIGSKLNGRYTIERIIGVGGMSVVFKAHDELENRAVSLKILRADKLGDQESRRRFFNESRAIAMLSHPNIVNVYDVNFEGKIQYIVMEYVDGVTLKDRMDQKGKLSPSEAIHYLRQILSALEHAHERGVIHHDIKPQNILLLPDATVKVTDFGIASVPNFEEEKPSDETVGSVHYISPEQAKGEPTDEKSDLYSVGVMMYAMMTGRLPFDAESTIAVALMQVENAPYPPCRLCPELQIGFQQVIFKAMAKDPEMRYQSASEMLQDLVTLDTAPDTVFSYPQTFPVPAKKEAAAPKGLRAFFRSCFPEDEGAYRHSRNNVLAVFCAFLVATLIVVSGIGIMVAIVSNLYEEYVNVPSYIGLNYEDVESNYEISKNFRFQIEYEYDNTVASGIILDQSPVAGESVISGQEVTLVVSQGARKIVVPELSGKTESQAITALKNAGLTYQRETAVGSVSLDEGVVLRSEPAAGAEVPEGTVITFFVNIRAAVTEAFMPNVVGSSKENAITALYQKGLTSVSVNEAYSDTVPAGVVISQSEPADSAVAFSKTIILTVSKGPAPVASESSGG